MKTEIIIAGHGGQGVLELANNVSYLEVLRGRHVAYTPSYGPESRGGKVKCYVVFSDGVIDSPIVEEPDYLIVMNIPSMEYVPLLRRGGTLLMNSSLILSGPERDDIVKIRVPATGIADELKGMETGGTQDTRIMGNSVMLGAYLAVTGESLDTELLERVFSHFLTDRKSASIPINLEAVRRGYRFIADARVAARP